MQRHSSISLTGLTDLDTFTPIDAILHLIKSAGGDDMGEVRESTSGTESDDGTERGSAGSASDFEVIVEHALREIVD